ncbi:phosphoribosylglycinamide formyltransferase 2 [Boudabousia liubingyangii]|uniref:Formate-dependent phosphoribosylglycinamide formyltransferase n=1 Tax=Boudabousia liubingyangii TaxID=1921764 RepID=A0A1Q5PNG7_9ACTO|nr:formate-dependent phosphoribosylglycinamide formyltransferase [Boudabousia liubingyangii]OKL49082.1 phosphoribosylglycinamide formyltransferase 2 [Boudabousia liubingyangii]
MSLRIGTPNTPNAHRVLLLGGGELGREVAIALMRLGVEVHVADRYAGAPAMQVAHHAHVLKMTDAQALTDLINEVKPYRVVPEVEALNIETLVALEAAGTTKVTPTAYAVQCTMDRQAIRHLAAEELQLPTSPYAFASTFEELAAGAEKVSYPCFVKPTMSSSGHGQSYVKTPEELKAAWDYAHEDARAETGRVIVEGKVDFDFEITLLTVRYRDAHTGKDETRFCEPIGHRQDGGDYVESWQPQPLSARALERAQEIAKTVTSALGGHGIFGVELFIKGDEVIFSELSPRPHDTGMVTMASQRYSQFDLHARALMGLHLEEITQERPAATAVIKAAAEYSDPAYLGLEAAMAVPGTDLRIFAKPEAHPGRRMGVALASGPDVATARERAQTAANLIQLENN